MKCLLLVINVMLLKNKVVDLRMSKIHSFLPISLNLIIYIACDIKINLNNRFGEIWSPTYYPFARNSENITWSITSPLNTVTIIKLIDFNFNLTDFNSSCLNFLFIEILNEAPIKFCKESSVPPLYSHGKDINVLFVTNNNEPKLPTIRFKLFYSVRDNIRITCSNNELSCLDGKGCYKVQDVCNLEFECNDHSDELNCGVCPENMVSCNSARSLKCFDPRKQRCDGELTCQGGEDELRCTPRCPDGLSCSHDTQCISKEKICDGFTHCLDKTDEINCTFRYCGDPSHYFLCLNKNCIQKSLVNDGIDDCGDESDEFNLKRYKVNYTFMIFIIISCLVLAILFFLLVIKWKKSRRNMNDVLSDLPQFPLPPFTGPNERETDQREMEVQYSESDFLFGGPIYEEFVDARQRSETRKQKRLKKLEKNDFERSQKVSSTIITYSQQKLSNYKGPNDSSNTLCLTTSIISVPSSDFNDCFMFTNYFDSFVDSNHSMHSENNK